MRASSDAAPRRPAEGALSAPSNVAGSALAMLAASGLDVLGCLDARRYDALVPPGWRAEQHVPGARSALVIGSGGGAFARLALARGGPDPVDGLAAERAASCVAELAAAGHLAAALHAGERRDARGRLVDGRDDAGVYADFVALGRESGLGVPSRLRLLLHPRYGPWLALRSVVLTTAALAPTAPLADFAPCDGCPAPCRAACPADALGSGYFDAGRCVPERLRGGACARTCASRRACVVGAEHAPEPAVEAHFMAASLRHAAAAFEPERAGRAKR